MDAATSPSSPPDEATDNQPLDLTGLEGHLRSICTVEVLGSIEPADLAAALSHQPPAGREDAQGSTPTDLKKIRERHHSVARLIAQGLPQTIVAKLTGYTDSHLSLMLDAPAMTDLVAFYRQDYTAAHEVMVERFRTLAETSLEQLQEKVDAGECDAATLLSAAKLGADRSGSGPQSTQHIVSEKHIFDHAELQKRNHEARRSSASRIIPAGQAQLPAPESTPEELGDAGA